ncbi:hypothetical protein SAMN06265360_1257 [Haloechinothrix alba]|uniref:Uncharacterized protein n=1 Tax=Haloechinothrix alba TaxID=664784 RepID=A0A238ZUF8_9PSEU|nr:hypothetical protein [Haloechinothrix alba]SNR86404.1 hypothetical protein SAMN06265360_1257 [Haloechinothrix alba]
MNQLDEQAAMARWRERVAEGGMLEAASGNRRARNRERAVRFWNALAAFAARRAESARRVGGARVSAHAASGHDMAVTGTAYTRGRGR